MTANDLAVFPFGTVLELHDGRLVVICSYAMPGLEHTWRWCEDSDGNGRYWRLANLAPLVKDWALP